MSAPEPFVPDWVLRLVEHTLSMVGFVLTGLAGILFKNYRGHIAMLTRHERWIKEQADVELGQLKAHQAAVSKGLFGDALTAQLIALKTEDERIHRRVTERRKAQEKTDTAIAAIKTDISWIREAVERIEKNQSE